MAIAFDAATNGGQTSGTSHTFSHTCTGANRILFVGVLGGVTDYITGATYNSVEMTLVDKKVQAERYHYLYVLHAPATGANNVVISASSSDFIGGASISYTGAEQTSTVDNKTLNGNSSTTSLATSLTTVADNCWTVLVAASSGTNAAAGTGSTARTSGNNPMMFDSNSAVTPAGSYSMTITRAVAGELSVVMASFAPAATSLSPSISPSLSLSISPSVSPSQSPSASISPSISPSPSPSPSSSISPSISPSTSPSQSISPSISLSASPSVSPSISPSPSASISPSISPSLSASASISPSISPSQSPSSSVSPSPSPGDWDNEVKHSSSWVNGTRNTSAFSNGNKSSSTWYNQTKN